MRGSAVFGRIVIIDTALLAAIAFEHHRIQIQRGAEHGRLSWPKTNSPSNRREMFELASHKPPK